MKDFLFTSEFVSPFHVDKVCDFISDTCVDAYLAQDRSARVALEVMFNGTDHVWICGEITANNAFVDISYEAFNALKSIGFPYAKEINISSSIAPQSPDISQGVSTGKGLFKEQGSGDNGIIWGGACTDTEVKMPAPVYYARKIIQQLETLRKNKTLPFLVGDAKSQVTVRYENGKPVAVDTVVVNAQHKPNFGYNDMRFAVIDYAVKPVIPETLLKDTKYFFNTTGRWIESGDSGCVGRKLACEYGSYFRNGGGSICSKDPSKVDRSAAYYTRYIAKNVVTAGIASKFEVQLAYAIGKAEPVAIFVDTFGTSKYSDEVIIKAINEVFDARPANIIEELNLLRPIYRFTTNHQFGISASDTKLCEDIYTWERVDKAEALADAVKTLAGK